MDKKRKKINILTVLGYLLVTIGVGTIIYDVASNYFEKESISKEKENFLSSINTGEADPNPNADESTLDEIYGILTIDSIGVDNPVSVSGNYDLLYRYLVAYEDSKLPPNTGNFSIVGHNGNCANCGFRNLERLVNGDIIRFTDKTKKTYTYEVYQTLEVDKSDIYVLDDIEGETTLTLITCKYPSLTNPERLVVRARLING